MEGDRITLFNTLDFGIFYDSTINKVYIEVNPTPAGSPTDPGKNVKANISVSFAPNAASTSSGAGNTVPKVHHANVICDQCDREIYGFRYKCMECWDYDLCMNCEAKMNHKDHIMLRIPTPKDADFVSIFFF